MPLNANHQLGDAGHISDHDTIANFVNSKGQPNGVAPLDATGAVPSAQLANGVQSVDGNHGAVVLSGTYVAKGAQVLDEADYASLTAALAAATAGSTVLVRRSITSAAVTVPADVTLKADGHVTLTCSGTNVTAVTLSDRSKVVGFKITITDGSTGVGFGTTTDAVASFVNVQAAGTTAQGFVTGAATRPTIAHCSTDTCKHAVVLATGCTDAFVIGGVHTNGQSTTTFEAPIYVAGASRARVFGVTVRNAVGMGFYDAGTNNTFTDCTADTCGTVGNDHRGAMTDGSTQSTWIGCQFLNNIQCGFFDNSNSVGTKLVGCTSAGNNAGHQPNGNGYEINGASFEVTGCKAIGTLGNAAGQGSGFYFGGSGTFSACQSDNNWWCGFSIYDANHVSGSASQARNNCQAGTGSADGFLLNGSGVGTCQHITLTGCIGYDTQVTKTQRYGIAVSSTNVNLYAVTGCISLLADNKGDGTNGFYDGGGPTKVWANNLTS